MESKSNIYSHDVAYIMMHFKLPQSHVYLTNSSCINNTILDASNCIIILMIRLYSTGTVTRQPLRETISCIIVNLVTYVPMCQQLTYITDSLPDTYCNKNASLQSYVYGMMSIPNTIPCIKCYHIGTNLHFANHQLSSHFFCIYLQHSTLKALT